MKTQVAEKKAILEALGSHAELREAFEAVDDRIVAGSPPMWISSAYNESIFSDGIYNPTIVERLSDHSKLGDPQWAIDPILVIDGKVSILSGNRLATILDSFHWFSAFEFLEWYYTHLDGTPDDGDSIADPVTGIWTAVAGNRMTALYGSFKDKTRVRQFMRNLQLSGEMLDQDELFARERLPDCISESTRHSQWRNKCLLVPRDWFRNASTLPLLRHIQHQAAIATGSLTRRLYGDSAAAEFREAAHHAKLAPEATRHLERLYWVVKRYSPGWQVWDGNGDDGPFAEFQNAFGEHYGSNTLPLMMIQNVVQPTSSEPIIFPFTLRDLNDISLHEALSPHLLGRLLEQLDDAIRQSEDTDLVQTLQESWELCAYTTRTNFLPRSVRLISIDDFDGIIEQQAAQQNALQTYNCKPSKQSNFRKGGIILSPLR